MIIKATHRVILGRNNIYNRSHYIIVITYSNIVTQCFLAKQQQKKSLSAIFFSAKLTTNALQNSKISVFFGQ